MRRVSTWLSVLALAIQCLVVQTHVHGQTAHAAALEATNHLARAIQSEQATQVAANTAAPSDNRSGAPGKSQRDSDATCLLCQIARASVGAVDAPQPVTQLIRVALIVSPVDPPALVAAAPRSHAWQSRAPPSSRV